MNTTNLTKSFAEKYVDVDSISSVIALSGMTAVTEVSTSASSYTFEINKNYKWIPSNSGQNTVNFTVYSGEVHGIANLYVDLTNGGTLSFENYVNVIGSQIDNGINKIILEWWGTVKTAYLNCEIGSTNNTGGGQLVDFIYSAYHSDKENTVYDIMGNEYDCFYPIYEGCGNYYDTGFVKNNKPVYTNGKYSLYYRKMSGTNKYRWVFIRTVPSADNFSSDDYVDMHNTLNTLTPIGDYRDGSIVVDYNTSLIPSLSGLTGLFIYGRLWYYC